MEAVFIPAPTTGNMFGTHLNQKELIVEIMEFVNTRLVASFPSPAQLFMGTKLPDLYTDCLLYTSAHVECFAYYHQVMYM